MSSQTTSKALPILIVLVVCCCVSSVTAGGLWAGNVFCDTTNPDDQAAGMNCASVYERSPAPGPAPKSPATLTPLQTLLASGQAIQVAELTITSSPKPVIAAASQPTGITATGSFTLSLDINMTALPGGTNPVRVIGQGTHPGSPALWLFPAGSGGGGWFKFHNGGPDDPETNSITLVSGTTPPVYNTYYNITAVYDAPSTTTTLYYNGVSKVSLRTIVPAKYTPPTPTAFGWTDQNVTAPTIKVKNTYWFNKALTAAEVATLSGTSSGPSSGYMPEPYTVEKDFAGY